MLKKNISLLIIGLTSSLVSACGSTLGERSVSDTPVVNTVITAPVSPVNEQTVVKSNENNAAKIDPATAKPTIDKTSLSKVISDSNPDKDLIINEVISMLSDDGLIASGLLPSAPAAAFTAKFDMVRYNGEFYIELDNLCSIPYKSKAWKDKVNELRGKYPYYFRPIVKPICFVTTPKTFRFCNEDGS